MSATSVKFYHSQMTGAAVLTGQAGKLIDVLDAVLVNGWGLATVDSVVIASGVATVTRAGGHPFEVAGVALIADATVTGGTINGEHRVLSTTATTYTFDATGLADQTATGTITHKVPPLGWVKAYSGTNLAAYKSGDPASTLCLMRVDDTGTSNARVVGYETMSDVNTGTGPFPTAAQVSGGTYWPKSYTTDATARYWQIVGDERTFYMQTVHSGSNNACVSAFGDILSRKASDAYACTLQAPGSNIVSSAPSGASCIYAGNSSGSQWVPRQASNIGSSAAVYRFPVSPTAPQSAMSGSSAWSMAYPDPVNNALLVAPVSVGEGASGVNWRGTLPGLWYVPQNVVSAAVFAKRDSVTGVTGLTGRTLKAFVDSGSSAVALFDVTGPWR
jgi:hypothetical protein